MSLWSSVATLAQAYQMGINTFYALASAAGAGVGGIIPSLAAFSHHISDIASVCADFRSAPSQCECIVPAAPSQCECIVPAAVFPWALVLITYTTALVTGWVCRGWLIPRDLPPTIYDSPAERRTPPVTPRESVTTAPRAARGPGALAGLSVRPESLVSDVYSSW